MKHEYFMVAVHDLCETMIIENFPSTIPPIGSKSISDFIFEKMPYDLKITNYFGGQTREYVNKNKQAVAEQLLAGADIQRIREQAKKTINNWGLNRFYFLVEDQDRWIKNPEGVLSELINEVKKLKDELNIKRAELDQEKKNTEHYKKRVDNLEEEMMKLKAELAALKQSQTPTPSTSTPVSSCDEVQLKKPSIFLKLAAEAEEIIPKKTKKNKKIEDALKEFESDIIDFVD
jgi:uncharacterized protein (DUF3084 family)